MVYVPLVPAACGSLGLGDLGVVDHCLCRNRALGGASEGAVQDEVAQLLSISPWMAGKSSAGSSLVALKDGAFLFHSEESKAQRSWATHPGSHSQDKASQGTFCPSHSGGGGWVLRQTKHPPMEH